MDASLLRQFVDAQIRPARCGSSLAVDANGPGTDGGGGPARPLSRYHWTSGEEWRLAVYGRSRYGADRYAGGAQPGR